MAKHKGEEGSFKLVPEDQYPARISKVETKPGKDDKKAKVAHFTFTIRSGRQKGSSVKNFYNMKNKNQQAVDIAIDELKHLAWCGGLKTFDDKNLQEFKGMDVLIDVSIDGKYNRIDKVSPLDAEEGEPSKKKKKKKNKQKFK